jgi:isopenicillin N synthase-like dioxygenase
MRANACVRGPAARRGVRVWHGELVQPGIVEPPIIDIGALVDPTDASEREAAQVGARIVDAGHDLGFFQIIGHGVDPALRAELLQTSRRFFALPADEKEQISMAQGGPAWRGWFPIGGELTSGVPDGKEGLYFGLELDDRDPRVRAGLPMHGANLFPQRPPELQRLVLAWIEAVTDAGHAVLRGIAVGLGLAPDWFDGWCAEPTVLFRIFHYPPPPPGFDGSWGVAEHTDYGLLTLLAQDDTGGLEVRVDAEWVSVPPVADAFVCNLGDMLERMTGGRFRSTPHRVGLPSVHRYSMPLFLDPAWDARIQPLPGMEPTADDPVERWDDSSVFDFDGTYGDYLTSRVARVFPDLAPVLDEDPDPVG